MSYRNRFRVHAKKYNPEEGLYELVYSIDGTEKSLWKLYSELKNNIIYLNDMVDDYYGLESDPIIDDFESFLVKHTKVLEKNIKEYENDLSKLFNKLRSRR